MSLLFWKVIKLFWEPIFVITALLIKNYEFIEFIS
jgi:hypothetical protein